MRGKLSKYLSSTVLISVGIFTFLPNAQAGIAAQCRANTAAGSSLAAEMLGIDLSATCAQVGRAEELAKSLGIDIDRGSSSSSGSTSTETTKETAPLPTAKISANSLSHAGSYTKASIPVNISFDNEVTGLTKDDLTVTNGKISSIKAYDGKKYGLNVTPTGEEDIIIELKADSVENADGGKNDKTFNVKIKFSAEKKNEIVEEIKAAEIVANTAKVSIELPTSHDGLAPFVAKVQFSKDVVGFTADDLVVTNGTIIGFAAVSASLYAVEIQPANKQEVSIKVASGAAHGSLGYKTKAKSGSLGFTKGVEETVQTVNSFLNTRTKSILRHQPRLSSLLLRTAPSSNSRYGDLALNGTGANHQLSFFTSHSRINNTVQAMNAARAIPQGPTVDNAMTTHSTNPTGTQVGELRGAIDHDANALNTTGAVYERDPAGGEYGNQAEYVDYANSDPTGTWDLWTKFESSKTTDHDDESTNGAGFVGLHYFLNERTIFGVMAQFDWVDQDNKISGNEVKGTGWMVGPYIAGQFQEHNLFYDARVTYGRANNKLSIAPSSDDEFDSSRLLVSGTLTGEYVLDDFLIQPGISATYYKETQEAYTDNLSNKIPEQTVSLGELRFGPTFSQAYDDGKGNILTPSFGFSGIYTYASSDEYNAGELVPSDDSLRLELDGGFNILTAGGQQLSLAGFYDGIGDGDYSSYGGSVGLSIPLQ